MVKAQAVLFDMDGVVIDTRQSIVDFWQALAVEHGVLLTDADYDQHIHGVPAVQTLRALFPSMTPEQTSELMERMLRYERGLRYTEILGVTAFLRRLSRAGVPTGLVTSGMGWKVDAVVEQLGLGGLFDVIVTARDIKRGKPDPDCYLTAARKLGVAGSECVVFEDAISGARAAVAAGTVCVGVQTGRMVGILLAAGARHVIPDFTCVDMAFEPSAVSVRLADAFTFVVARR